MRKISKLGKEALKEIADIGASSASNALSQLTKKKIVVKTTRIEFISPKDIRRVNEAPNQDIVGVLFGVRGDIPGGMVSLTAVSTALNISDLTQGKRLGSTKDFDVFSQDTIKEVGNILVGAYLAALSDKFDMNLVESTPRLVFGDSSSVIQSAVEYNKGARRVMVIESCMVNEEQDFIDEIVLILDPKNLEKLTDGFFEDKRIFKYSPINKK